jgi:hypothetical protein
MSSSTYSPELELQHLNTSDTGREPVAEVAWPYCAEDGHPLGWWRMLPPHLFGDTERLLVGSSLEGLAVIGGGKDFAAALKGDAAAAISVALSLVPLREVILPAAGSARCRGSTGWDSPPMARMPAASRAPTLSSLRAKTVALGGTEA